MTKKEFIDRVKSLISCITFEYHGMDCGVDPLSKDDFDVWCGDNLVNVKSVDEVMNLKIFDGNPLDMIFGEIVNLDY